MYAKISSGTIVKFPYSFGQLRKDNPKVSFPRNISSSIMARYGMVPVAEGEKPTATVYQKIVQNELPTRPVIGQYTEEDAPMPSMVGEDIIAGYWELGYTVVDMTEEEIAEKDAEVAAQNRVERDKLLAETDWVVIKAKETGTTLTTAWKTYRQALRDISEHANWPHLEEADWPVKP